MFYLQEKRKSGASFEGTAHLPNSMDLLICVLMVILALLLIGLWYLYSSGLFFKITVETVVSPYPNFQVAYKFFKGPYKNVGKGFEDVYKLAPEYQCFAVYYDDPNQVSVQIPVLFSFQFVF